MVNTCGKMEELIRVNEIIMICMGKVHIFGKMEEVMLDNIKMIKKMDMEFIHGRMEEDIKGFGRMGYNMVKDSILVKDGTNGLTVYGKMVFERETLKMIKHLTNLVELKVINLV